MPVSSVFEVKFSGNITYKNIKKINLVSQTTNLFTKKNKLLKLDYLLADSKEVVPFAVHWSYKTSLNGGRSCFMGIKPSLLLEIDKENQFCKMM